VERKDYLFMIGYIKQLFSLDYIYANKELHILASKLIY